MLGFILCLNLFSKTVIHAGYLFDVDSASLEPEMSIVVNEEFIEE